MMNDDVLQATLLLSCYFNKSEVKSVKPLTPTEYARFASWLHQQHLTPADLLYKPNEVLAQWLDPKKKITAERIQVLMARGVSMGFALENWAKHGIWVLSRANPLYPQGIKEKLGTASPAILFGVGNQQLLNKPGIGFVGSRSVDRDDENFTRNQSEHVVKQGHVVVSGGAKGIDQTSMLSALNCGGESVGILADSLLKASASKAYREGLRSKRLVLISPFYPEAGFNTGNAMGRNKYIYAMSKAVVAVKSDEDKGGTWAGAIENLKRHWVPLLVRDVPYQGNQALIQLGGHALGSELLDVNYLPAVVGKPRGEQAAVTSNPVTTSDTNSTGDMFSDPQPEPSPKAPAVELHSSVLEEPVALDSTVEPASLQEDCSAPIVINDGGLKAPASVLSDTTAIQNDVTNNSTGLFDDSELADTCDVFSRHGKLLTVFYQGLKELAGQQQDITPANVLKLYPELTDALIKKWLKLLADESVLNRQGRKLIYTLNNKV